MTANGARFPHFDEEAAREDEIEIAVQVNGKMRAKVLAAPGATDQELEARAREDEKVAEFTAGKETVKVIVVPDRLVNIVVR